MAARKRLLKRKAKQAVPGTVEGTKRPNKAAIAAGAGGGRRLLLILARKSSDDEAAGGRS